MVGNRDDANQDVGATARSDHLQRVQIVTLKRKRKKKKKKHSWIEDQLKLAMVAVDRGAAMATAARAHGTPRSTLASHVTSRSKST